MITFENGVSRHMTPTEVAELTELNAKAERAYWSVPYEEAVDREIKLRYSPSAETALLRQRDTKPVEFAKYNAYCEECKALVKAKQAEYA